MSYSKEDAELNKLSDEVNEIIAERRKNAKWWVKLKNSIDFSNALRYIKNIANIKQKRKKAMENNTPKTKTTKKSKGNVSVKTIVASVIAAPFIVTGVASLIESDVPYLPYALGALIAGLVIYLLVEK